MESKKSAFKQYKFPKEALLDTPLASTQEIEIPQFHPSPIKMNMAPPVAPAKKMTIFE